MQKLSFHHPIPTAGQNLYNRVDRFKSGAPNGIELRDQILDLADRFIALDNPDRDQSRLPKHVVVESPAGRVKETFSYSQRETKSQYRDREGYWETHTQRDLSSVDYKRQETNAKGEVTKEVVLSYVGPDYKAWSMTVTDKHGKSIASGREDGDYQVAYFAK